jgi:hypothetical protein
MPVALEPCKVIRKAGSGRDDARNTRTRPLSIQKPGLILSASFACYPSRTSEMRSTIGLSAATKASFETPMTFSSTS